LLQIHDELVFEILENRLNEAVNFIKKCMEEKPFDELGATFAFDVPIVVEASYGRNFGNLKVWEADL
jgi:DNA polymerase-1